MLIISISTNDNNNIPIRQYALNAYKDREWAGDAEKEKLRKLGL